MVSLKKPILKNKRKLLWTVFVIGKDVWVKPNFQLITPSCIGLNA
jgi:hypothetical protein